MRHGSIVVIVLWCMANAALAGAETYAVRVIRDLPYLQGANYADAKDKLDLYLPEGRSNAPVIVWYYGNQLMGGDKSEDEFVGRRFASAAWGRNGFSRRPTCRSVCSSLATIKAMRMRT